MVEMNFRNSSHNLSGQNDFLNHKSWPPAAFSILDNVTQSSNQIIQKTPDGLISGIRYVIEAEPSSLRTIKSWTITIEKWFCKNSAAISVNDILSVRLYNDPRASHSDYNHVVKTIIVKNRTKEITGQNGFNAVMAAILFISKIDAGRIPDSDKILKTYHLTDL